MCSGYTYLAIRTFNSCRGAILAQLAFILPVILLSLFIFIWVASFIHGRVVLRDTLQVALKQGATLGKDSVSFRDPSSSSADLPSKIRAFRANTDDSVLNLLSYRPDAPTSSVINTYNSILSSPDQSRNSIPSDPLVPITGGIRAVPPEYLLTLILMYEGVRNSLGKGVVKYPCTWAELKTKPGCLTCSPIVRASSQEEGASQINAHCLSRNKMRIMCSLHNSFPVIDSISNLIQSITGGGKVSLTPIIDEVIDGYSSNSGLLSDDAQQQIERTTFNCEAN